MATARRNIVDSETPGFYHCTNRCVRRAFLCGVDNETGRDHSRRKLWVEERMMALCNIFSVDIYAFAVMSNHYHMVLYLDPLAPKQWTDEQVADRWIQAFPGKLNLPENSQQRQMKMSAIMADKDKLKKYRKRLGSLSWFMGRLNEPIAKRCNKEEFCTGRFWEGRYFSQALLDEAAVFSCMSYVDLNPVRAKIVNKLEDSKHTSIKQRLDEVQLDNERDKLELAIGAVAGNTRKHPLNMQLKDYIQLVEWTGQSIRYPDKASMPANIVPILERLNLQQDHWLSQIKNYNKNYCRVVGPVELIREKAKQLKVRCLHGISAARQMYVALT